MPEPPSQDWMEYEELPRRKMKFSLNPLGLRNKTIFILIMIALLTIILSGAMVVVFIVMEINSYETGKS